MISRRILQRCKAPCSSIYNFTRTAHPVRAQCCLAFNSPAPTTVRWYSSAVPDETKPQEQAETPPADEESTTAADPLMTELNQKNRELAEIKDRYRHSVADFRNLQDRTQRDMQAARDFAISRFAKDLIDSVDNLDRALSTVPQEKINQPEVSEDRKDLVALYEGLKMTESILMNTLKKHGLERFDPSVEEEKFNPNEHEAIFMSAVPDKENNTVFQTQQKGFKLNGRVLRAAKVGVVKNP